MDKMGKLLHHVALLDPPHYSVLLAAHGPLVMFDEIDRIGLQQTAVSVTFTHWGLEFPSERSVNRSKRQYANQKILINLLGNWARRFSY